MQYPSLHRKASTEMRNQVAATATWPLATMQQAQLLCLPNTASCLQPRWVGQLATVLYCSFFLILFLNRKCNQVQHALACMYYS